LKKRFRQLQKGEKVLATDQWSDDGKTKWKSVPSMAVGIEAQNPNSIGWVKYRRPVDPAQLYWAITGRLVGQDEDSGECYGPCARDEAIEQFTEEQLDGEDLEFIALKYGGDASRPESLVYINGVFSSVSEIESE
jgi:hypothetical protein